MGRERLGVRVITTGQVRVRVSRSGRSHTFYMKALLCPGHIKIGRYGSMSKLAKLSPLGQSLAANLFSIEWVERLEFKSNQVKVKLMLMFDWDHDGIYSIVQRLIHAELGHSRIAFEREKRVLDEHGCERWLAC